MTYFELAADHARQFKRAVQDKTHWQHPDYPSYGCCGTPSSRFSAEPTCALCKTRKAQWDAEDDATAQALGLR